MASQRFTDYTVEYLRAEHRSIIKRIKAENASLRVYDKGFSIHVHNDATRLCSAYVTSADPSCEMKAFTAL